MNKWRDHKIFQQIPVGLILNNILWSIAYKAPIVFVTAQIK